MMVAALLLGFLITIEGFHTFQVDSSSSLSQRRLIELANSRKNANQPDDTVRRHVALGTAFMGAWLFGPYRLTAAAAALQESLNVETFLKTGMDTGGNMGVSSQAGKSRPQTGIVFRDGSDVSQDREGNVLTEILVGTRADPKAVLVSFASPWTLAKGPAFDVECLDPASGDGAFVAVTRSTGGKPLAELPTAFFLERLFDPTGRFSFYGPPTDIRVKSSKLVGGSRYIELSFSNLSQSTNSEIPRRAVLVAAIPSGTENAVMLVGSATANRWKKGAEESVRQTVDSFRATAAPRGNLKLRPKERGFGYLEL